MAALLRTHDGSGDGLGPPASWPQSLRSVVHLMLGSAFPMFACWGPSLHTIYNDAYAEIMGDKHPGGVGRPFLEIWSEIRDELVPLLQRVMGGESFYMENLPLRMRRHGYEEDTWFTFSWSPLLDDQGRIAGMYCACAETTRMVLAENRLRARELWLQSLFDQAPGFAAVVRGPAHVFEMANPAYVDLVGGRPLLGLPLGKALPELAAQGFVALLDEVQRTGVPYVGRSIPVQLDGAAGGAGRDVFVDFMYQPLRDAGGQVQGVFMQGHDVTEQHRAQLALQLADQQKDEFLATLAHELRNPLAPLRSAATLLASPAAGDTVRRQAVDIIGRQVSHMGRLLDDLIDLARITQRRVALRKQVVTVDSLVDSALEAARPLAEAKGHALAVDLPDPGLLLEVDPVRIVQVLSNLLNNACKYTDAGGRITLSARRQPPWLCLSVTDNGVGIGAQALPKLFSMFSQEASAIDRSEGGLGIGLALVRGLVELHGGRVHAASDGPGQGTRMTVELPLADGLHGAPSPAQAASAPAAAAGHGRRVLVADDNRDACAGLAQLLSLMGHAVHTANDGEQAVALALAHRPEVLILDIGMPVLNGYDVAREVRRQPWGSQPYLVAATGWSQDSDRRQALDAGFDLHLTKPFDIQRLTELLARPPRG